MITLPSANRNLFGMKTFFDQFKKLYNEDKMPSKIMLSGKKGVGKSTLAYHIINYILSANEEVKYDDKNFKINEKNKSFKLVQNNTHPNFYLIDLLNEKKNIDIDQIRKLIMYTNKSSFNDLPRFILIDNIENLNTSSTNALLKLIEEPNKGIFFILIHNIEKNILPTLKSRCISFKINFNFTDNIRILNQLLDENIFDIINFDLINYYNTPGEVIRLISFCKEKKINLKDMNLDALLNLLIEQSYYKKNEFVKNVIVNFIEHFFLKEFMFNNHRQKLLNFYYYFINKNYNSDKFNLDYESLFLEFKSKMLNG